MSTATIALLFFGTIGLVFYVMCCMSWYLYNLGNKNETRWWALTIDYATIPGLFLVLYLLKFTGQLK